MWRNHKQVHNSSGKMFESMKDQQSLDKQELKQHITNLGHTNTIVHQSTTLSEVSRFRQTNVSSRLSPPQENYLPQEVENSRHSHDFPPNMTKHKVKHQDNSQVEPNGTNQMPNFGLQVDHGQKQNTTSYDFLNIELLKHLRRYFQTPRGG